MSGLPYTCSDLNYSAMATEAILHKQYNST